LAVFLAHTGEEQFFEVITEIAVIVADSHDAGLDDVCHNLFTYSSTFYPYSMGKRKMLHQIRRFFLIYDVFFTIKHKNT